VIVSAALTVTEKVPVAVFEAESVTFTPNIALPATGVVPDSTPALDRLSPIEVNWLLPEVTVQVKPVPVPPAEVNASE
jgi:hypothetical protein